MSDPKLPLYSNFCKCAACGKYFGSVSGFDRHRRSKAEFRACQTKDALLAKNWFLDEKGYWRLPKTDRKWHMSRHHSPRTDDL